MKTLDPALQAHLDDGTTTLARCWAAACGGTRDPPPASRR